MATFQTAYTDLLDYANRTSTELGTQAKREINNAILWLQRKREWKMTERLIRFTVPANTLFVNLSAACEGTPRSIISTALLTSSTATEGKLLDLVSYDKLMRERRAFQRAHEPYDIEFEPSNISSGHNEFVTRAHELKAFLVGANNFGLYPTNTTDRYILMNLSIWLPQLVDNSDTNFFLTYAYDLVIMKAFKQFSIYLKEDRRTAATNEEIVESYNSLVEWDTQIRAQLEQNG
jgi:hypothetical protein